MKLGELKSEYDTMAKKYSLPKFESLNEDFNVEKIKKETAYILRTVRRAMMDRVASYLGFIEALAHPVNAPPFMLVYIKSIDEEDKNNIESIYKEINDINLSTFILEIDYSEKAEAEAIKSIYERWGKVKQKFKKIFSGMQKSWNAISEKKEKTYFG